MQLKANQRYEHGFAVVRVDRFLDVSSAPQNAVTVTKVLLSQAEAEAEVARLNQLNKEKATYFWQITRLGPRE